MMVLYVWIGVVSLISVVVTVKDKLSAMCKSGKRVREKTLFVLGALGGAAAMFLTMRIIRHKTRHRSFMVGLPLIIVFHVLVYLACNYL